MPRERIQHGKLYVETDEGATDVMDVHGKPTGLKARAVRPFEPGEILKPEERVIEEQSLEVGWNRDGEWVQVSITAPKDWWARWTESWDGTPDIEFRTVYTSVLTRQEINNMIRTLRRARDAAYGSDE